MSSSNDSSGFIDGITRIDDILRESHSVLKDINNKIDNIEPRVVTDKINVDSGDGGRSFQLEMSANIPSNSTVRKTREIPFDGVVNGYIVGFPDGADQAVGLGLEDEDSGNKLFPRNSEDRYFAANDFTVKLPLRFKVHEGMEITTYYKNNDPSNPHFINSMLIVEEGKDAPEVVDR